VAEEGRGENEVVHPVNPAANAAANAPANPADNAPTNVPANATGNVTNNAANTANIQGNVVANPGKNAGAQPPPIRANHAEGSQCQRIRDEVEIAQRANYDREHGSLTPSMPTTPSKQRTSDICMTKNSYDMATTTMTMVLPVTFTSSKQLTPCEQARERSITSLRSHDVSG
jgi:hypothetical protein